MTAERVTNETNNTTRTLVINFNGRLEIALLNHETKDDLKGLSFGELVELADYIEVNYGDIKVM